MAAEEGKVQKSRLLGHRRSLGHEDVESGGQSRGQDLEWFISRCPHSSVYYARSSPAAAQGRGTWRWQARGTPTQGPAPRGEGQGWGLRVCGFRASTMRQLTTWPCYLPCDLRYPLGHLQGDPILAELSSLIHQVRVATVFYS